MSSTLHSPPEIYHKSNHTIQQSDLGAPKSEQTFSASSQDGDSESLGGSLRPSEWTIGWTTPLTIVITFVVAIVIAVAHYLYCHFLNNKFVASTIPQSWNNAVSVAFAHGFSTALAASASTAFTQLLWWYLRRRDISLSKIDTLFSLNSSPVNLYQLGILRVVPILWFFGLLIPLISVATIFPPGSLVVQQLPDIRRQYMDVPTLDVDYRGNGSAADFFTYAMFTHGSDGEYRWPDVRYSGIGKRTLLEGSYLTRPSPCGANCTYSLVFSGPSLRCEEGSLNQDLETKVFGYYSNSSQDEGAQSIWDARGASFMAAPYSSEDQFKFDLSYHDGVTRDLKNMSCTTWDATYNAHIQYENSIQRVTVDVEEHQPLNASLLGLSSLFYDVIQSIPTTTGFTYTEAPYRNFTMDELSAIYHGIQLRTIRDTLIRPLSGAISSFGTENYFAINTIVQETHLAHPVYNEAAYTFSDIFFALSPVVMEDLMRNVTISTFNDAENLATTLVETTIYKSAYVFKDQFRLIGAYVGALVVCLAFVLLGFGALIQNGTAATSGGFFQILCTTTHSDGVMNQLAREASLRSTQDVPKELAALKVRFGIVTNGGRRHAAFGTAEETRVLLKGS